MRYGIALDLIIIAVLGFGFLKGYRKGLALMSTPVISFVVGMLLLRPVGSLCYVIFGDDLEYLAEKFIFEKTGNTQVTQLLLEQILNESLIERVVEIFVFVLAYMIISSVASAILVRMRLRVNNQMLNTIDKNLGGTVGVISELLMVYLVLAIFFIMFKFNFADKTILLSKLIDQSFITKWLYSLNPIVYIIGG